MLLQVRGSPSGEGVGAGGARNAHFMPCCKMEFLLVLQMMRSAHWTTTMLAKKAVWQVYSTIFLLWYVWGVKRKSPYTLCKTVQWPQKCLVCPELHP